MYRNVPEETLYKRNGHEINNLVLNRRDVVAVAVEKVLYALPEQLQNLFVDRGRAAEVIAVLVSRAGLEIFASA